MEAFSNASEVWVVSLLVKASLQGNETRISENRSSSSSSCPKYFVKREEAAYRTRQLSQPPRNRALTCEITPSTTNGVLPTSLKSSTF